MNELNNKTEMDAEELTLAPETELFEEAKRIAEESAQKVTALFFVEYDTNRETDFLALISEMGSTVEGEEEGTGALILSLNEDQLAFLKTLDYVERLRENRPVIRQGKEETLNVEAKSILTNQEENGIMMVAEESVARSVCTCCCTESNTMETAFPLTVGRPQSAYICCPEAEQWFSFVADTSGMYTVYTESELDTVGYMYDAQENMVATNDDEQDGRLNFKMEANLTAGQTYYIRVREWGTQTGGYTIYAVKGVPVTSLSISATSATVEIGKTLQLSVTVSPSNATDKRVLWFSSNERIATVDDTGKVTAVGFGVARISVYTWEHLNLGVSCEVWVRGKTPVFLIHGRTSNSLGVWGAANSIWANPDDPKDADNNHFNPSIDALSKGIGGTAVRYTDKTAQDIVTLTATHEEGGNLACHLKQQGYKENVNLFVFNYPNEDAVVHSAEKFKKYIENLTAFVRSSGTAEMKHCFYASQADYDNQNHKINIVGHSMGGLVARYYIENLGQDSHVDKLITICTPHWGSWYAETSCVAGTDLHKICDHDLRFESAMYGETFSTTLNCKATTNNCYNGNYTLTNTLLYSKNRDTKYYAIAAIDYKPENINSNNYPFEIPNDLNTYQSLIDYMTNKSIYKINIFSNIVPIEIHDVGDNMVGLLSQIGWTKNDTTSPNKKITMEKIFLDVDANGGNGDNIPFLEMFNMLHNKAPHRTCVMEQVNEYLNE